MQPQNQYTPAPVEPGAPRANQYDFILNNTPQSKPPVLPGGQSLVGRILIVVGGLIVLIIISAIVIGLLISGGSSNKAALLSIAQDQTEIIRLTTSAAENATSQSTKNFAITAKLAVQSQRTELLTYMKQQGQKTNDKQLILKQSAETDSQLAAAKSSSTYDQAFQSVMQKSLNAYGADLSTAYEGANSEGKKLLQDDFNSIKLLQQMNTSN